MRCPVCGGPTRVIETREYPNDTMRRRRECSDCDRRFTTREHPVKDRKYERKPFNLKRWLDIALAPKRKQEEDSKNAR